MNPNLISDLRAIVGDAGCLYQDFDRESYETDYRRILRGRSRAVVRPISTDEVSRIMAYCYQYGIPAVPQGGNTSLMGGSVPSETGDEVIINLSRLNRVLDVDTRNDTLTVQAGCTLAQTREAGAAVGRLFPLRIGSEGTCQIGGNLSTNAGGTAVLRYGNMRDLVLGLEVVLPDGKVWSNLKGLRKDNTGYDLKHLFVGSEGTLGLITAAVLKLFPLPRNLSTAFIAVPTPAAAVELLTCAKTVSGQQITAFELMSRPSLELVLGAMPGVGLPVEMASGWYVLMELTNDRSQEDGDQLIQSILERGMESGWVIDAAIASSLAQAQTFWKIREEISDAQTREGGSIRCDISVPISQIAQFIDNATVEVKRICPAARMVVYGHVGDGNVHFNPLRPSNVTTADFLKHSDAMTTAVDNLAAVLKGSISAEHGVGVFKRQELLDYKSHVELELFWKIKNAIDPTGILNRGKVIPSLNL